MPAGCFACPTCAPSGDAISNEKQVFGLVATFIAVAEAGSFKRGAERVGRSPPAVTRQINLLEQILGVTLLVRTTRSLRLTAAGAELLERGKRVLVDTERLVQDFQVHSAESSGKVMISVSPTIAVGLIPKVLRTMEVERPLVRAFLREDLGQQMIEAVETGAVDFGIGPYSRVPDRIQFEPVFDQEFLLILPFEHPIARRGSARVDDLASLDLVLPSAGSTAREVIEDFRARVGLAAAPKYETMQYTTLFALVAAGLGATIMPPVDPALLQGSGLLAVPIRGHRIYRTIGRITRRGEPLTRVAEAFLATFLAIASQERHRLRLDA